MVVMDSYQTSLPHVYFFLSRNVGGFRRFLMTIIQRCLVLLLYSVSDRPAFNWPKNLLTAECVCSPRQTLSRFSGEPQDISIPFKVRAYLRSFVSCIPNILAMQRLRAYTNHPAHLVFLQNEFRLLFLSTTGFSCMFYPAMVGNSGWVRSYVRESHPDSFRTLLRHSYLHHQTSLYFISRGDSPPFTVSSLTSRTLLFN